MAITEYRQVENRYNSKVKTSNNLTKCFLQELIIDEEWGQRTRTFRFYWYDEKKERYVNRIFLKYEDLLVRYLLNCKPEKLQNLLDNGKLYVYIRRTADRYSKAVENQVKILNENDTEMQQAKENGDLDKYHGLWNNNIHCAEEMFYDMLYH